KLLEPGAAKRGLLDFLKEGSARGLVVEVGLAPRALSHPPLGALGLRSEATFSVPPMVRTLTLRRLRTQGRLVELGGLARALLNARSRHRLVLAIIAGDPKELNLAVSEFSGRETEEQTFRWSAQVLRHALCSPFDAAWLENTWRDHAP